MAITGVHAILSTKDAVADRALFADVVGMATVDAGEGWLIFALPPARTGKGVEFDGTTEQPSGRNPAIPA